MTSLPSHVRSVLEAPVVARQVVAAVGAVVLVVPRGVAVPDDVHGLDVGPAFVAGVDVERAVGIARGRSERAAQALLTHPGEGFAWVLYLDRGQGVALVPVRRERARAA